MNHLKTTSGLSGLFKWLSALRIRVAALSHYSSGFATRYLMVPWNIQASAWQQNCQACINALLKLGQMLAMK